MRARAVERSLMRFDSMFRQALDYCTCYGKGEATSHRLEQRTRSPLAAGAGDPHGVPIGSKEQVAVDCTVSSHDSRS